MDYNIDGQKLDKHIDRVHQWKYGNKAEVFPIYVEISPVGHCNHRCTFCAVDYIGYVNRKISKETLKEMANDMALHGVRSIMFAGEGEPLLHPDIIEVTNATKKSGIDVAFTTNATPLTEKFCEEAMASCSWIKISCNAGDPSDYIKIHKANNKDWDRVWKNIEFATNVRRKRKDIDTVIGVQCVLLPDNQKSLKRLAKRCEEVGVDYLVVKPYSQHLKSNTQIYSGLKYDLNAEDLMFDLMKYDRPGFEVIFRINAIKSWNEEDRKKSYKKCLSTPFFWAYVMATGDVYGCSAYLGDDRFLYGNVNKDSFSDIWLGDRRRKAIGFVDKELDISECRKNCRMNSCNKWLWEVENGSLHKNFI